MSGWSHTAFIFTSVRVQCQHAGIPRLDTELVPGPLPLDPTAGTGSALLPEASPSPLPLLGPKLKVCAAAVLSQKRQGFIKNRR